MRAVARRVPGLRRLVRRFRPGPRLTLLRQMPGNSVCAEIGVHEGQFSREILSEVRPRELHLIDPWKHEDEQTYDTSLYGGLGSSGQAALDARYERVRDRFAREMAEGRVAIHRETSDAVAPQFADGYFDWVYIDGNHLYEYVLLDLESYFPKVRSGGYLTGDDYGIAGWWDNGVQRAVDEFASARPELQLSVFGDQFVIQKP